MRGALLTGGPGFPKNRTTLVRFICSAGVLAVLMASGGCASNSGPLWTTAKRLYAESTTLTQPTLDPKYSYLRAVISGREVFLALGYLDTLPEGITEVWYSGSGEVVRIRNGRIVGTTGLATDWRAVRFSAEPGWAAPSQTASAPNGAGVEFARERDITPGYRWSVRDRIYQNTINMPLRSGIKQALPAGQALRWFEERSVSIPAAASVPPARFAVADIEGRPQVVYSEQCLTTEFCMSLERWSADSAAVSAGGKGS